LKRCGVQREGPPSTQYEPTDWRSLGGGETGSKI